jgi:hypothetical protein
MILKENEFNGDVDFAPEPLEFRKDNADGANYEFECRRGTHEVPSAPDYGVYDYINDPRKTETLKKYRAWNYEVDEGEAYCVKDWTTDVTMVPVKGKMGCIEFRHLCNIKTKSALLERIRRIDTEEDAFGYKHG